MSDRSKRTDGAALTTVEEQADDLHRLISALGCRAGGPLRQQRRRGERAGAGRQATPSRSGRSSRTSRPTRRSCPTPRQALAAARDIHETYMRGGRGPGMAKFMALTSHKGEIPADWSDRPAPDPAMFGLPTEDDGSRDDPLMGQTILSITSYQPDFDALRGGVRRGSCWRPARSRRASSPIAAPTPWRSGLGTEPRDLPEPPRRIHGWRVRLARQARRVRREAPRGPRLLARSRLSRR